MIHLYKNGLILRKGTVLLSLKALFINNLTELNLIELNENIEQSIFVFFDQFIQFILTAIYIHPHDKYQFLKYRLCGLH